MKYFKNSKDEIYAYESDGSQDHLIPDTFVPVSEEYIKALNDEQNAKFAALNKVANCKAAVKKYLDDFAKLRDYDSIEAGCSYAVSSNKVLKAEGKKCSDFRDAVWAVYYSVIDTVKNEEELMLKLPPFTWTAPEEIVQ